MRPAVFVSELLLLFQVHATISFGQELFCILAISREHGAADTERKNVFAAYLASGVPSQSSHLLGFLTCCVGGESGSNHHEFIAAHARHVIVFAASIFKGLGKQTQNPIALQMSEAVVDLLKSVHIGHHDGEAGVVALATR